MRTQNEPRDLLPNVIFGVNKYADYRPKGSYIDEPFGLDYFWSFVYFMKTTTINIQIKIF